MLVYAWRFKQAYVATVASIGNGYFLFLSLGSILGAYIFGTLNLYLMNELSIGRSVLGALVGAIFMIELYKVRQGIKRSTGYVFVVPFCLCIIIGRLGCFFSGIADQTAGVETSLPWGYDFGDGILRHPVQLYECISMLLFLVATLSILRRQQDIIVKYGFYFCVGFYAIQRFVWEFLKPYSQIIGSLNLFHLLCIAVMIYSLVMIYRTRNVRNA